MFAVCSKLSLLLQGVKLHLLGRQLNTIKRVVIETTRVCDVTTLLIPYEVAFL